MLRRRVDGGRLGTRQNGERRSGRRLIVCGDDPLAHRIVEELVRRYRVQVTVILPSRRRGHGPDIERVAGVEVVESERLDADAFRRARITTADAVALVHQDDVGNINAALLVHELNPGLRLVIRMFNGNLGQGVRRLIPGCRVLSDAAMAAPAFASAALGEVAPEHVRLGGRTVYVARRAGVRAEDVVCGLARTVDRDQPELLPSDESTADLVLAVARGVVGAAAQWADAAGTGETGPAVVPVRPWPLAFAGGLRRLRRRPFGNLTLLVSRKLRLAALALSALLVTAVVILKVSLHGTWLNAAYTAVLDTLGGANPNTGEPRIVKVTEIILAVVSIALIPVITAAVVEVAVNARLALALGRLREPISDHVVVVGLGNVGTRVIRRLHDLGVPMVAVDRNEDARGVPVAQELNIPYIIGEANRAETLRAASVRTCRALVVVSTDDAVNLETALQARGINGRPARGAAAVRRRLRRPGTAGVRHHDLPERVVRGRARVRGGDARAGGGRHDPGRPPGAADRRGTGVCGVRTGRPPAGGGVPRGGGPGGRRDRRRPRRHALAAGPGAAPGARGRTPGRRDPRGPRPDACAYRSAGGYPGRGRDGVSASDRRR